MFSGNHTLPSEQLQDFVVPYASLSYGEFYRVESDQMQVTIPSAYVWSMPVWQRDSGPADVAPGRVMVFPSFSSVNSNNIAWTMGWSSSANPPNQDFLVTLCMASWTSGIGPTEYSSGHPLLINSYGCFPTYSIPMPTTNKPALVSCEVVFNNISLVGSQVAFQFVGLLPSNQVITSDVAGVILQ